MNNGFVWISSGAGKEEKMGNNENMLPQEKEKKGTKKGIAGPGDIGGGLAIGFGTLCFCFWANAMGFCDTEGFELAIGVVLLGFFVIYLVGGLYYLRLGNTLSGCVYVVFATSFGLFGGAVNVGHALCSYSGIPFDNTIGGISFLISGTFVLFLLPGLRYSAKVDFLVFFFAGIGVCNYQFRRTYCVQWDRGREGASGGAERKRKPGRLFFHAGGRRRRLPRVYPGSPERVLSAVPEDAACGFFCRIVFRSRIFRCGFPYDEKCGEASACI